MTAALSDADLDRLADRIAERVIQRVGGLGGGGRPSLPTRAAAKLIGIRQVDLAELAERAEQDGMARRVGAGGAHVHWRWLDDRARLRAWVDSVRAGR